MAELDRRTFLRGAIAGGLVAAAAPQGVWAKLASAPGGVKVYLIIVDGLRADEVWLMPQLSELAATGTFYPHGRAEMVAETSPNHVTLLTGMRATRHGVPGNAVPTLPIRPSDEPRYVKADSILTLMRRQAPAYFSATIGAKTYVADLAKHDRTGDGSTDASYTNTPLLPITLDSAPDEEIGSEAVRVSREHDPDFLFVNLGDVDRVGHVDETGGLTQGTAPIGRRATLQRADAQLRALVTELRLSGRWERTVFMVTADHSMDWSFRDRGLNLAPLFEDDDLLSGEVRAAINGGASLYALRSPDDPLASERLRRMREIAVGVEGIRDALYIRPNPLDDGEKHWVGRVYPQWGLAGDFAGDLVVTVEAGYRLGHSTSAPAMFANPIPGNHGHPATLPIPVVVAGGWPGIVPQVVDADPAPGVTEEDPGQARNIDLVPTAAWLLGLYPPPGGFDGRVLEEAFSDRPEPRVAVANVASMPHVERVGSDDSVETAVALSQLAFPEGADAVVLAPGHRFQEPLVAVPLASDRGAPLLLGGPVGLDAGTRAEVERLGARRAYIVGSEDVIGVETEDALAAAGVEEVRRFAGPNAADTARLVALELGVSGDNRQVVLVSGDPSTEALAAGPVAAADHPRTPVDPSLLATLTAGGGAGARPILFGGAHATTQALAELEVDRVIIAGSTASVDAAVEDALRAEGILVERIGEADPYETARLLVERGIREGAFTDEVHVVNGQDLPFAMIAGAALGRLGGSLVVTPPDELADPSRTFLHDRADEFVRIRLVGGPGVLSTALQDEVVDLVQQRRTRQASV